MVFGIRVLVFSFGFGIVIGRCIWPLYLVLGVGVGTSMCIGIVYWSLVSGIGLGIAISTGSGIQ